MSTSSIPVPPLTPPNVIVDNDTLLHGIPDPEVVAYLQSEGYTVTVPGPTPPDPGKDPVPNGVPGNWKLQFREEFDAPLNSTIWNPHWFSDTGKMNKVTTVARNVSIANSCAQLLLSDQNTGALICTDPAQLNNKGFQFTTGFVEWFAKFTGNGSQLYNWPAVWTTGQPTWPAHGENDIAEVISNKLMIHHINPDKTNPGNAPAGYWGDKFHTFGMQRFADHCDYWWDGAKVWTVPTKENVAQSPQFLVANIGQGEGPLKVGEKLLVDYVRVWQPA